MKIVILLEKKVIFYIYMTNNKVSEQLKVLHVCFCYHYIIGSFHMQSKVSQMVKIFIISGSKFSIKDLDMQMRADSQTELL